MAKRKGTSRSIYRKNTNSRYISVSFVLFTISFFLFVYLITSNRWVVSTDLRSFATAQKTQTPTPKKKTAASCSQWCAGCGGFCADGENDSCNALATKKCGEKPCYAAGPDGKSYLCSQAPAAPAVQPKAATQKTTSDCTGESSKCSCDPNPVCNTVLRDMYHSSCPEYCDAYAKKTITAPVITSTVTSATVEPPKTITTSAIKSEKFGARCVVSAHDCGSGLDCLATPYGYYCGVPSSSYKTRNNGETCGSVLECSNSCTGSFYRNTDGIFYCGTPPITAEIIATTTPQFPAKMGSRCSLSANDCGDSLDCLSTPYGYYCGIASKPDKKLADGVACDSIVHCNRDCETGFYKNTFGKFFCGKPATNTPKSTKSPLSTSTKTGTSTPKPQLTVTIRTSSTTTLPPVASNVCNNPILEYAAVGRLSGDILPLTYVPNDLVNARPYFNSKTKIEDPNTKLSKSAIPMFTCFEKVVSAEGYTLGIYNGGGFRDCEAQKEKNSVDCGYSEHQTGLAADLFVIDKSGVRHEISVNPNHKDSTDATLQKMLNKADDCGLAHPITYDDPHFFAVASVVNPQILDSYDPLPRQTSNMQQLNETIRKQQQACKK